MANDNNNEGIAIRVIAYTLLLRWSNEVEPRRAMKNQPMNTLESLILVL